MRNLRMEEKLKSGDLIDVAPFYQTSGGDYVLPQFFEGMDYADCETEEYVWSIGKRKSDGTIFASVTTKFYMNPDYECLWLR